MQARSPRPTDLFLSAALVALLAAPMPAAGRAKTLEGPDKVEVQPEILNVRFDGRLLSQGFVLLLAQKPVIDWGGISNEAGTGLVEGELWFTVARDDGFVYYHLTDEPNAQKGPTAYGGYTVKIKAKQTASGYNLGAGEAVPVIGNDKDGFLLTATEVQLNSSFVPGPGVISMETGEETFRLIHLFDEIRTYNIPYAASAGRSAGWQLLAPDGAVLNELTMGDFASSSTSDCVAAAESAKTFLSSTQLDVVQGFTLGAGMVAKGVMTAYGPKGRHAVDRVLPDVLAGQNANVAFLAGVTGPLYTSLAERACEIIAGTSAADLSLTEPELEAAAEAIEFVPPQLKCLQLGSGGSTSQVNDDGSIEVTGLTVCKVWEFVVE